MFRHILVPVDGSAASLGAVRRAARFAREQKARLTAFWVAPNWEPNLYAYAGAVPAGYVTPAQHEARARNTARRHLQAARAIAASAGVRCATDWVQGSIPYLEIVKASRRHRCDLIAMASHSRGLSRLIGSQTSKVLAHATVPVLVCK